MTRRRSTAAPSLELRLLRRHTCARYVCSNRAAAARQRGTYCALVLRRVAELSSERPRRRAANLYFSRILSRPSSASLSSWTRRPLTDRERLETERAHYPGYVGGRDITVEFTVYNKLVK